MMAAITDQLKTTYVTVYCLVLAFALILQAIYVITTGFHFIGPLRRRATTISLRRLQRILASLFYLAPGLAILAFLVAAAARGHSPPRTIGNWLAVHEAEVVIAIAAAAVPGALLIINPSAAIRWTMKSYPEISATERFPVLISRMVGTILLAFSIYILAIALQSSR